MKPAHTFGPISIAFALLAASDAAHASAMPSDVARVEQTEAGLQFLPRLSTTPANPQWIRCRVGDLVAHGESKTGGKGGARLRLADGSIVQLGASTRVTFDKLRDETHAGQNEIELDRGELVVEVSAQTRADSAFVVRTALAAVKPEGTRFSVREQNGRLIVHAVDGAVRIEPRDGRAAVTIDAGQQIALTKSEIGPASPLSAP